MDSIEARKKRIAKMLRLQQSTNAHEAANAAAMAEKWCREYGISPKDLEEYTADKPDDAIIMVTYLKGRRVSVGLRLLLRAVALHFNSEILIHKLDKNSSQVHVIANKTNQVLIELYFDYLQEALEKCLARAKYVRLRQGYTNHGYGYEFSKGFAVAVHYRLELLKQEKRNNGIPDTNITALAVVNKDKKEQDAVKAALSDDYKRKISIIKVNKAYDDGVVAGEGVSLRTQLDSRNPAKI